MYFAFVALVSHRYLNIPLKVARAASSTRSRLKWRLALAIADLAVLQPSRVQEREREREANNLAAGWASDVRWRVHADKT